MVASALCLWRMLAFYNLTYPTSSPDPLVLRAACRARCHISKSKTHAQVAHAAPAECRGARSRTGGLPWYKVRGLMSKVVSLVCRVCVSRDTLRYGDGVGREQFSRSSSSDKTSHSVRRAP